jgi:hypothetical protein
MSVTGTSVGGVAPLGASIRRCFIRPVLLFSKSRLPVTSLLAALGLGLSLGLAQTHKRWASVRLSRKVQAKISGFPQRSGPGLPCATLVLPVDQLPVSRMPGVATAVKRYPERIAQVSGAEPQTWTNPPRVGS